MSRSDTLARIKRNRRGWLVVPIVLIIVVCTTAAIGTGNTATSALSSILPTTSAAAPSPSSSPTPNGDVHFNFGNGTTEGWMSGWGPVSVASSTAHPLAGTHSLAITTQGGYSAVGADVAGLAGGTSVTYRLFSPSGGVLVMPFVSDTSFGTHFAGNATLAQGWNAVVWTVPQVSVLRIGLQVNMWSGTLYLGNVTWGGSGAPSAASTPGPNGAQTFAPAPGATPSSAPAATPASVPAATPASAPAATPTSAPAATPTSAPAGTQGPNGPVSDSGYQTTGLLGGRYELQANEWNSSAPLTVSSDGRPDFTISTSGISTATDGAPGAYPSLFRGCHWGNCTTDSGMPISVAKVEHPGTVTTTDKTSTVSGGAWDDAYDIWFNQSSAPSNNGSGGMEMMVWLNHEGSVEPAGSPVASNVNLGGRSYTVWYAGSGPGGTVSYVLSQPSTSVTNLDLAPLAADAVSRGYMSSSWWLIDVEAGFEPWQGGQGLAITSFNVCDPAGC